MKKNHHSIIRDYLATTHLVNIRRGNADLLKNGSLDSFSIVELVNFLEKEFQIKIKSSELQKPGLFSLNGLSRLVAEKLKRGKTKE